MPHSSWEPLTEDAIAVKLEEEMKKPHGQQRAALPASMTVNVKVAVDDSLATKLGGASNFKTWMDQVMTQTQTYYCHQSLGTQVKFQVSQLAS